MVEEVKTEVRIRQNRKGLRRLCKQTGGYFGRKGGFAQFKKDYQEWAQAEEDKKLLLEKLDEASIS